MIDNVIEEIRTHNVIVADELAMPESDCRYDEVSALVQAAEWKEQ